MKGSWAKLFGYLWLVLLALVLLVSAAQEYAQSQLGVEYATGCDAFGYLRMARVVRHAVSEGKPPNYQLEAPHTRQLIEYFYEHQVPFQEWDELVAPHAHHYFPQTKSIGPQYPPGTGLLLAIFPEGKATSGLDAAAIVVIVIVGLACLILAARMRSGLAAGGVIFSLQAALRVIGDSKGAGFSITATALLLLISYSMLFLALGLRYGAQKPRLSAIAALFCGAGFGLAILVRLPVLFLVPGALLLLMGKTLRTLVEPIVIAMVLGFALFGALPLFAHQQQVTGVWHHTTYSSYDNTSPRLQAVLPNFDFYFMTGAGSGYAWFLLVTVVGWVGVSLLAARSRTKAHCLVGWGRIALGALLTWAISTIYFLTHPIAIHYYQVPATIGASLVLSLGGFVVSCVRPSPLMLPDSGKERYLRSFGIGLALIPGVLAIGLACREWPQTHFTGQARTYAPAIPDELTDGRAWVFADELTGTLWYYRERPAYKAPFASKTTLEMVYRYIDEKREPLYVVRDSPAMDSVMVDIQSLGGTLEERGHVDGCEYYLVHWR